MIATVSVGTQGGHLKTFRLFRFFLCALAPSRDMFNRNVRNGFAKNAR